MYPGSIHLAHIHADEIYKDLLVDAARARQINEAIRQPHERFKLARPAGILRHNLGVALVRLGHRLQDSAPPPAADRGASLGSLHAVR